MLLIRPELHGRRSMRKLLLLAITAIMSFTIGYEFAPPQSHRELHVPEDYFDMVFSPTDSQLITFPRVYGSDKSVRIWNFDTGSEVAALTVPQRDPIDSIGVEYAPDGQSFVAGNWNSSNLYSRSGDLLHRFERCSTRYSPDAQFVFVETTDDIPGASGWPKKHLALWNIREGRLEWSIPSAMPLAFDSNGSHFVTLDQNKLNHWELSASEPPRRLHEHAVEIVPGIDPNLQFFVDADRTKFDAGRSSFYLRDMKSSEVRITYTLPPFDNRFSRPFFQEAKVSNNDRVIIIERWPSSRLNVMPAPARVTVCEGSNTFELLSSESAKVLLSENKRWLGIRSSDKFLIWDMANMREHLSRPIEGNTWPATLGLTANGDYFFTRDELNIAFRASWDSFDKACFGLFSRFWPDTSRIQVWDMLRRSPVLSIPFAQDAVFSPDGRWIATQHEGGIVRIWNIAHHTNWPIVWKIAVRIWIGEIGIGMCFGWIYRHSFRKPKLQSAPAE